MHATHLKSVGILVSVLLGVSIADPALAQGRGRGQGQSATPPPTQVVVQLEIDKRDRDIITRYYRERQSDLPPGLATRDGSLPPGLEKQLVRNGTLPPGLQKRITPFPRALERQLTPLPDGYRRGIIDRHVIVYRPGTFLIADVILDIVR